MRIAFTLFAAVLMAFSAKGADPLYLDQLIETPVSSLQAQFGPMKKEGCFQIAADRFLLITMAKRDQKPWRVVLSADMPCKKPINAGTVDVRERSGVNLGDNTVSVVERMGRPDASAAPDTSLRKLGESEYLYMCRVEEGCARHTSVLIRDGRVSAIAQWYSE